MRCMVLCLYWCNVFLLAFTDFSIQEAIREALLEGYDNSVSKLGYSGTAIISRIKPLSVTYGLGISDHDSEGRLVTVEFDNFYLLSCYVPNSGDGLRRLPYRTGYQSGILLLETTSKIWNS